ncbi:hypothetical protein SAMN02745898_11860 [Streptomyces sp. 136MFCol5.1]|nr:hypothetical protein SAMN02745898_11860 [Streptomyces sp. 136MFCol5.1]SFT29944.1 hypothetical protein SAMN04487982_11556 [Streptomyces sp. ok210]
MGVSSSSPEIWADPTLKILRAELAALTESLAEAEAELVTVTTELDAFSRVQMARLAPLYAELDELVARLAERTAQLSGDSGDKYLAQDARDKAGQSARDAEAAAYPDMTAERLQQLRTAQRSLRDLYRELARSCHPDLAGEDGAERRRRENFMARVNAAYAAGDGAALRALAQAWASRESAGGGPSTRGIGGDTDVRKLRERIRLVRARLGGVRTQIAALRAAPLGQLCFADDPQAALDEAAKLLHAQISEHRAALVRRGGSL